MTRQAYAGLVPMILPPTEYIEAYARQLKREMQTMTDDFEDPPNDIPDEPPAGAPTTVPDQQFPDEDAIDGTEDDATTSPEDV